MIPLGLFLLACAAVYVGTVHTAFTMLMRLSLRLVAERDGRAGPLGRYLDDPLDLFVPARLLLGLVSVLAMMLLARLIGTDGAYRLVLVGVSAFAFVVVCEHVIPALIARHNPEAVIESLAPSFGIVARFVRPLTLLSIRLVRPPPEKGAAASADALAGDAAQPAGDRDEGGGGLIEGDERALLKSIVEFGDTLVREVMTPRPDIAAIEASATLDDLRTVLREQGYSRLPVYRGNLDNILGFVFVKDLIQLPRDSDGGAPITGVMRPAYFVPETKPVSGLLREFQREQLQIAIVVDEYGGTAGMVTIEDLLEELVGEIRDEYDRETEPVIEESDGVFLFTGKASVDELVDRLGVAIEREGFDTVGGYLLSRLGRVPAANERVEMDGLAVEVLDAERRRVTRVRIRRQPPTETPAEAE